MVEKNKEADSYDESKLKELLESHREELGVGCASVVDQHLRREMARGRPQPHQRQRARAGGAITKEQAWATVDGSVAASGSQS